MGLTMPGVRCRQEGGEDIIGKNLELRKGPGCHLSLP